MVIAIEQGLDDLSARLRQRGYTIVSYPEYGGVVDAFIYKEEMTGHIDGYQGILQDSLENYTNPNPHGILMVNANNKSFEQIEEILKKRIYSPLF